MSIFLLANFLLIISLIFPYLSFIFFPGFLLFFLDNTDFLLKINLAIGISFAYWIITFWFLYFPIFQYWVWGSIIIVMAISFILAYKKREKKVEIDYFLLSVFLILGIFRFFPMIINEAPPGGDITMHTYNTLLITLSEKIPENYQPIFNMKGFGAQPQGFSILSAIFAYLSKLPAYRATFFLSCFTYFLILGGFYVFLRCFLPSKPSLFTAAILTIFSRDPQNFYLWGGTPTILAFFFSLLSFYFFIQEIRNSRLSFLNIILLSFLISAGFLTHFIPLSVFLVILLSIAFYKLIFQQKDKIRFLMKILFSFVFLLVFSLPYFIIFRQINVSEREWQVIFDWNNYLWRYDFATQFIYKKFNFLGFLIKAFLPFVKMILTISCPILILGLVGLFFIIKRKKEVPKEIISFLFFIVLILLYLNLLLKIKFTQIFYPERTSLYFLLPFGIIIGRLIDHISYRKIQKFLLYFLIFLISIAFVFKISSHNNEKFFSYRGKEKSIFKIIGYEFLCRNFLRYLFWQGNYSLTKSELKAFEWIKNNCEEGIILTNYSDAGIWIPAILGRPVYLAHVVFNLFDEYEDFIKNNNLENFKYLHLGSKTIGRNIFFTKEYLPQGATEKIYEENGVIVYRIFNPLPLIQKIVLHEIPNY